MLDVFSHAIRVRELRYRIGFTLLALLVFRLGCQLPIPGIDAAAMARLMSENSGGMLGFFNLLSGGALERFSLFALGLQPYINASIIVQLLVHVIPSLELLQKEGGEEGRTQLKRYTRYGAVVLGLLQAFGVCVLLEQWSGAARTGAIVLSPGWGFRAVAVVALTAGSAFLVWLGSQITERGIGNGVSVLLTAGIVSRLPSAALTLGHAFELDRGNPAGFVKLAVLGLLLVVLTAAVVAIQDGVRKIPLAHARRMPGRAAAFIPLRVNQGGVMPVIFASSVLMVPAALISWALRNSELSSQRTGLAALLHTLQDALAHGQRGYIACEFALIIFFAYFYAAMQFDPREVAASLRKYGSFTPGIRAGRQTAEYLDRVLSRITLAGGVFLGLIALTPHLFASAFGGAVEAVGFGGTSLLIVVGVTLDTLRQAQSHALVRQYDSFMRLGDG